MSLFEPATQQFGQARSNKIMHFDKNCCPRKRRRRSYIQQILFVALNITDDHRGWRFRENGFQISGFTFTANRNPGCDAVQLSHVA
jgi:hypothetical protein